MSVPVFRRRLVETWQRRFATAAWQRNNPFCVSFRCAERFAIKSGNEFGRSDILRVYPERSSLELEELLLTEKLVTWFRFN